MLNSGESIQLPMEYSTPAGAPDPRVPLQNLSVVQSRMDSLQRFLSESVNKNVLISEHQMGLVSSEISSAIHQIIVNGAALLACSQAGEPPSSAAAAKISEPPDLKLPAGVYRSSDCNRGKRLGITLKEEEEEEVAEEDGGCEVVEVDAVELVAEHVHFCEVCGKGFKRDANLRMHMRAHGDRFKTPEALAKPEKTGETAASGKTRFSCPYEGCNRNKKHERFRPLKSVICVRNHFKRSHCPKTYVCDRCHKKSFSVVADLKSHQKHCGESRWRCSCGTSFSRKDKLFGHMALFEGHMPAVTGDKDERTHGAAAEELGGNCTDDGLFEGLLDGFGAIDGYNLQDVLNSPNNNGWSSSMDEFLGFGQQ